MFTFIAGIVLAVNLGPMASDAPAREPQMVVNGKTIVLAFGAGMRLYASVSTDSGKTFSAPVTVAGGAIVPLNRHRGPRVALSDRSVVVTAVVGKTVAAGAHAHGLPSDGDLLAWRSTDSGRSWSKGVVINDVAAAATEGLHALAADAKGNLFAAWLDKRGTGTQLYGARSTNGGLSWSKNILIYQSPEGTICQCCHPSLAIDSNGQILVMWRNCLAGSRDMYLARSSDGVTFSKPEKLGIGTWPLNACPMDGGGIAVSLNRIVTAWRREREVFVSSPGEKEVGIGEGSDVSIAAATAGVYVVWSSLSGVMVLPPGKKEPISLAPKGTFPNIVALPNGHALVAWEDDGTIRIQEVP